MPNIEDYLYWRGDLTFTQSPFNEVDGVILARLSYAPFEQVWNQLQKPISVSSAMQALLQLPDIEKLVIMPEDIPFMKILQTNPRFCHLELNSFENLIDNDSQTQFSAVTFHLEEDVHYIAFRGTDHTLIGWKEDFNMSYVCPVPSQKLAVTYLEKAALQYSGKLILGGHSKGGNLAVYAAAFCSPSVQKRIQTVYNFDGPGFNETILATPEYKSICSRVFTYVPQSSIVGMLLGHEEKYTIVHSTQKIIPFQHDTYSWVIDRTQFEYLNHVTKESEFLDHTLKNWILNLNEEQRELFVDSVYSLITETNAQTVPELGENWFLHARTILKSYKTMDKETKKIISEALSSFVKCTKQNISLLKNPKEATGTVIDMSFPWLGQH